MATAADGEPLGAGPLRCARLDRDQRKRGTRREDINPEERLRDFEASWRACRLARAPGAVVVRTAGLYGLHASASKDGNFVTRMIARAREQSVLKVVADECLTPTFTAISRPGSCPRSVLASPGGCT
jgi:RmlD substrate binding domain